MALTNWNDILNKPKGIDEVPEIALTVEQLSASVLSISKDVGEIALDVSQLSVSVLSIAEDVEELKTKEDIVITLTTEEKLITGQLARNGHIVSGSLRFRIGALTANTWTSIGSVNVAPKSDIQIPFADAYDASYGGILEINTSGVIRVDPTHNIGSSGIIFTVSYVTN